MSSRSQEPSTSPKRVLYLVGLVVTFVGTPAVVLVSALATLFATVGDFDSGDRGPDWAAVGTWGLMTALSALGGAVAFGWLVRGFRAALPRAS